MKWYVPEIYEEEADLLRGGNHEFHTPELILTEIASITWKKIRRGDVTATDGDLIITSILDESWTVHSHRDHLTVAYLGAKHTGQTVYDFMYLALAISLGCQFVTADEKFYRALEKTLLNSNLKWIGDFTDSTGG
jgi:predicted nucleic acid-binding protein